MKNYGEFLNEAHKKTVFNPSAEELIPIAQTTPPPPEIKLIEFNQLQEFQYIRLYHRGEEVGNFRVEEQLSSNPEIKGFDSVVVQKINDDGTFDITHGHFTIKAEDHEYAFQPLDKKVSAGIVFVYNDKILLVSNIHKGYTHPKGNAKAGEKREETASREVLEETGINFPKELLVDKPIHSLQYFGDTYIKTQYFYIVHLSQEDYKKYINYQTIPKENLCLDEIDWAGFVPIEEAANILQDGYEIILKYVN